MTILDELATRAKRRVAEKEKQLSLSKIRANAHAAPRGDFAFEKALRKDGLSFICECKKASPSKGVIADPYPYLDIAKAYEDAGADCVSVLTEPKYFLGDDKHLQEIAQTVSIPCLRKDFTVSPYMIYEAKLLGASCVLLICAILDDETLSHCLNICDNLGLSALTEIHDAQEAHRAVSAGAHIVGVNNRNLKDFSVDVENSARLRDKVPPDILFVAESGVQTAADAAAAKAIGADAVLVGETLMRAQDKKQKLNELKEEL